MAELVASELRTKILRGELKPGESLSSESSLVEEFDVSRPTLREALRLLEADQLVTVRRGSHRGPVVSLPDTTVTAQSFTMLLQLRQATVMDVYEFRTIFEPVAARLASERATDSQIESLRVTLAEEGATTADWSAFTLVSWRFHTELMRASGNVTMALVAETLQHISGRYADQALASARDRRELADLSMRAHNHLLDLVTARRGDEAEKFWAKHMAAAGEVLRRKATKLSISELLE
jgi:GntR family transcriptional regulator, transcriptional repressor for pyruvate dehydrogenase complex